MISASAAFNASIVSSHPKQRVLCAFTDPTITGNDAPSLPNTLMCWTDSDINLRNGVKIEESVNQNSELSIGQAVSATLSLEVFNEHGYLTNYMVSPAFTKDCTVYIGSKISESNIVEAVPADANCVAFIRDPGAPSSGGIMVTGHDTAPYLRLEGAAFPLQSALPSEFQFPIKALVIDGSAVENGAYILCIGEEPGNFFGIIWEFGDIWEAFGQTYASWSAASATTWGAEYGEGRVLTYATSYFMYMSKFPQFARANKGLTRVGNVIYDFADGNETAWEYHSVGVFHMDKPQMIDQYLCSFSAYDRMTRFDEDVSSYLDGLTYPVTLYGLLDGLCDFCGVPNAVNPYTNSMLNASVTITEKPDLGTMPNGRQLLQYIAEMSGTNARINRDGALTLGWIDPSFPVILIHPDYYGIYSNQIADYSVAQISKLVIEVPQDEGDDEVASVGTGDNVYELTANPLILAAGSTADVTTRITPIYNRLSAFPTIKPTILQCTCNWAIEAGDTINFAYRPAGSSTMTSIPVPVYTQTIHYKGITEVRYVSSGDPTRPKDAYAYGATIQGFAKSAAQTRKQIKWSKETGGSSDSKIAYVTCSTAASTTAKAVAATGPTQTAGTLLSVVFTNGNTADTPTLSLNRATALPVYSCYTNTNIAPTAITTGMTALLLCTGSAWILLNPKQNSFVVSSVNTSQSQLR